MDRTGVSTAGRAVTLNGRGASHSSIVEPQLDNQARWLAGHVLPSDIETWDRGRETLYFVIIVMCQILMMQLCLLSKIFMDSHV